MTDKEKQPRAATQDRNSGAMHMQSKRTCSRGPAERRMHRLRAVLQREVEAQAPGATKDENTDPRVNANEQLMEVDEFEPTEPCRLDVEKMECSWIYADGENPRLPLLTDYGQVEDDVSKYTYFVLDTCIFLSCTEKVQRFFISSTDTNSYSIVVLPYKLLQELDNLKHRKPELLNKVKWTIRFLNDYLRADNFHVKAQHPTDDTIDILNIESADDSILNCAMQVRNVVGYDAQVVLVSDDVNLLNKAIAAKLATRTMDELVASHCVSHDTIIPEMFNDTCEHKSNR